MAIIEEVTEEENVKVISKTELLSTLRALSTKLRLPDDLLPAFMSDDEDSYDQKRYRSTSLSVLKEILELQGSSAWNELELEEQGEVFSVVTRLYGEDGWTSRDIRAIIDDLSSNVNAPQLALHLLNHTLRPLFSASHPMLNPSTARALSRPAGGPSALSDLQNDASQIWKHPEAWGHYNLLAWCCTHIPTSDIVDRIGLILPPTLMMMDDWDPAWRGRGAWVLGEWIGKVDVVTMKRMGMDKLLLKSLIHTLSLHPPTPLPHVMPITLELIRRTSEGEKRAEMLSEIMEKAVISGWMYAPSGVEGRVISIQIAKHLEELCGELKEGVLRWMKSIIPHLLQPLVYPPTSAVLPHFEVNLSALLCVLRCTSSTGRVSRWRGQTIEIVSRLCIQLNEKEMEDQLASSRGPKDSNIYGSLHEEIKSVFGILEALCPNVRKDEYSYLDHLDGSVFRKYLPDPNVAIRV